MRTSLAAIVLSGGVMLAAGCAELHQAGGSGQTGGTTQRAVEGKGMTALITPGMEAWVMPTPNPWWKVEGDVLAGENDPALRGNNLYTAKSYKDVELEAEFRFSGETDTGIYLRRPLIQVQIGTSRSLKIDKTGSLYQEGAGGGYVGHAVGVDKLLKAGEWNRIRLIAKGDSLTVWLNGVEVLATSIAKYPEAAPVGVQIHSGLRMKIEYRGLRVREL